VDDGLPDRVVHTGLTIELWLCWIVYYVNVITVTMISLVILSYLLLILLRFFSLDVDIYAMFNG